MNLILQKTEEFNLEYREDDYEFIMDLMVEFNLAARSQDRNTLLFLNNSIKTSQNLSKSQKYL